MKIIAGLLKNRKIFAPKGLSTRPTSGQLREALFNICQSYIEGSRFLDLFAGSGAVGLEALSRGAAHATFVEIDRNSARCIEKNVELFQLEKDSRVVCGESLRWLENFTKKGEMFDIIFADPPYTGKTDQNVYYSESVVKIVDSRSLLNPGGMLFIEETGETEIERVPVESLVLKSRRRFGRSMLYQYQRTHGT